jgi:hypothetical protein
MTRTAGANSKRPAQVPPALSLVDGQRPVRASRRGDVGGQRAGAAGQVDEGVAVIAEALGAAVIGSRLNSRYKDEMASALGDCRRPMTANSATATADGMVVTLVGELVKVMSPLPPISCMVLAGFAARAVRHDLTDHGKVTAGS